LLLLLLLLLLFEQMTHRIASFFYGIG
jgi:uncharacterized protein involved in cysteine biosynthesis